VIAAFKTCAIKFIGKTKHTDKKSGDNWKLSVKGDENDGNKCCILIGTSKTPKEIPPEISRLFTFQFDISVSINVKMIFFVLYTKKFKPPDSFKRLKLLKKIMSDNKSIYFDTYNIDHDFLVKKTSV